jgi:hypothetical protein
MASTADTGTLSSPENRTVTSQALPGTGLDTPFGAGLAAGCVMGLAVCLPWISRFGELVWSQYEVTGPGQDELVLYTGNVVTHRPGAVSTRPGLGLGCETLATVGDADAEGVLLLLPVGGAERGTERIWGKPARPS